MPKPLGVVDVLVSCKPPEHGLSQHSDQGVSAVLARSRVGKPIASRLRKAESIVKLAIGKKPSIGGDDRTAKLEHQPAVEIEPKPSPFGLPAGFAITSASESAQRVDYYS